MLSFLIYFYEQLSEFVTWSLSIIFKPSQPNNQQPPNPLQPLTRFGAALLVSLSIFTIPSIFAQEPSLKIQTPSYTFDRLTDTYIYENATIEWGDISLEAGEFRLDRKNRKLTASEFVRYSDARILAIVDRLEIDLDTKEGVFYDVALFDAETQTYLTAQEVHKKGPLRFVARNCSITTCDPQDPAWEIEGEEVDYLGENFSTAEGATLKVSDVPIFYFPYLVWPTVTRRQSGFLAPQYEVHASRSEKFNLGFKFSLPYFWAISRDQDVTFTIDAIEQRGLGTGVDYQYAFREGLRGEVRFWQIQERDKRDPSEESGRLREEDIPGSELRPQRFRFEFNHNQTLDAQTRMILSGQIFSDSQFQREYDRVREPNPNYNQHLRASVSRQFAVGDASLSIDRELVYEEVALLNRNLIETRVQRLPELSFHFSGNLLQDIPLTAELSGSVIRFHRDSGFVGHREILTPRLRYRFPVFKAVKTFVSYGRRISNYQVYNPGTLVRFDEPGATVEEKPIALQSRENKDFGYGIDLIEAEINTSLSRVWNPQTDVFSKFKHLITPRLLFESIGDVNQTQSRQVIFPTLANPDPDGVDFFDKEDQRPGKQLLIFRIDNLLLAKRRLFERRVTLTERSLFRLRARRLSKSIIRRLDGLVDRRFLSERKFLSELEKLFANSITPEQKELILSSLQRGVVNRKVRPSDSSAEEGPSWVLSRLNIIQRFNLLRQDANFDPKGPEIEDQETEPGEPLLPLQIEWNLTPGPQFSVDFFLRYSYQAGRVVESKATFDVRVSPNNRARISFHNNEGAYRTPDDIFHDKTNTLSFSNVFEANDNLSFGFDGKLNLSVSDEDALQRRLIEDSFFLDYHPGCYVISLKFQELAERTTTSAGKQKEIVDPSISLTLTLGQVLPLPEQRFHF